MENPLLLFDGVCNLCNNLVQFILKHEKGANLKFGTLQSETVRNKMPEMQLKELNLSSIVYIENGVVFVKSAAVFRIAGLLKAPWSWFAVLRYLPKGACDFIYDFVAKYRYRIFGKRTECMLPEAKWEKRFL